MSDLEQPPKVISARVLEILTLFSTFFVTFVMLGRCGLCRPGTKYCIEC